MFYFFFETGSMPLALIAGAAAGLVRNLIKALAASALPLVALNPADITSGL